MEEIVIQKYKHTPVFIAALFTIQDIETTQMSIIDKWIKKIWCTYTMEYYSVIKNNGVMPFSATQTGLQMIALCEVRQRKTNII